MEAALTASMRRSSHEIFSGRFVLFVVQKEFRCYPGALTHYLMRPEPAMIFPGGS